MKLTMLSRYWLKFAVMCTKCFQKVLIFGHIILENCVHTTFHNHLRVISLWWYRSLPTFCHFRQQCWKSWTMNWSIPPTKFLPRQLTVGQKVCEDLKSRWELDPNFLNYQWQGKLWYYVPLTTLSSCPSTVLSDEPFDQESTASQEILWQQN